jgi:hypothetical protein
MATALRPFLLGADLGRDVIEHAVHERRRVVAAEALRDLDRLVDRHARRHVVARQ